MPIQPFKPHYPFTDEKLAQLKQIVPEAFEDGRLNFDTLREVLEPNLDPDGEVKDDGERFGLLWPGKKEARRLAAIPSKGTLAPVYGQGLKAAGTPDTDGTNDSRNVFIEGENLEVLKIMQKAYAGRVKMIYIDPPYNTGTDFIYVDDFKEDKSEYFTKTGQVDDEGRKLTTNTKSDGRYHSNWLSSIYPTLRLARNLLSDDGIIFVSIDHNESHNLKQVMNEVFGEENFRNEIILKRGIKNVQAQFETVSNLSSGHEYIFVYSKSSEHRLPKLQKLHDKIKPGKWDTFWRGTDRPTMRYELLGVDIEEGQWRWEKNRARKASDRYLEFLNSGLNDLDRHHAEISSQEEGKIDFVRKNDDGVIQYYVPPQVGKLLSTDWMDVKLKGNYFGFDTEKHTSLLARMIDWVTTGEEDIILDFFAGSGSTGHTVYQCIHKPKFVLVQAGVKIKPSHKLFKSGYSKISDVTIGRLTKANLEENGTGFRVFNGVKSQFHDNSDSSNNSLQSLFDQQSIDKTYNPQTFLWEVALNEGFPLDSRVETREVAGQTIQTLTSEFHEFALHCCFDPSIAPAAAPEITLGENDVLVCLDSALDDQTKLRLSDKGLLKTI
jgi:adenine-specific DNA-methyltransferase